MKILHVASEAYPFIKTGGLADVSASLPRTQARLGHDVRLLIPAYRAAIAQIQAPKTIAEIQVSGLLGSVRILETDMGDAGSKVWLVDHGPAFDRDGNPYLDDTGMPWPDNAERFLLLCRIAVAVIHDEDLLEWRPDVIHCHDWQTGMVAPLIDDHQDIVKIFTIHNLSYQGIFPRSTFMSLGLNEELWAMNGVEYLDQMSFIKGGIVFSDWITTVSPTYAREIQTADLGCGLEGLLQHRSDRLVGILNGIDYDEWDPSIDAYIDFGYDADTLQGKLRNKNVCMERWSLQGDDKVPLFGFVGRLVDQKGIDLLVTALPELLTHGYPFVVLGMGDPKLERKLQDIARAYPARIHVRVGYDEKMSHQIAAAADIFVMPSRFEPCGLNQMYSMHYGTVPIVSRTGGLADTVVPATPRNLANKTATGFTFTEFTADALIKTIHQGAKLFGDEQRWRALMLAGMSRDFSWHQSALAYLELYQMN
jgi:starch synthase